MKKLILFFFIVFILGCSNGDLEKVIEIDSIILIKNNEVSLSINIEGIIDDNKIIFALPYNTIQKKLTVSLSTNDVYTVYLNNEIVENEFIIDSSLNNILSIQSDYEIQNYIIIFENVPQSLNVLFLGNSITKTIRSPELEWFGTWGMAASEKEKDYVHLLISKIEPLLEILSTNIYSISWFERKYWDSTETGNTANFINLKPDVLIINIGENIDEELATKNNFQFHLESFIDSIIDSNSNVIIVNSFWDKKNVNQILEKVAMEKRFYYVDISDLEQDIENMAYGYFTNKEVESHPSDLGMRNISRRIYPKLIQAILNI